MLFSLADLPISLVQILILGIVSSSCSLIGLFLFYRRSVMMANAISHSVLLGIVTTFLAQQQLTRLFSPQSSSATLESMPSLPLQWALVASMIMACLTYYTVYILAERFSIPRQASIGIALSAYFALGIVLITVFGRNSHIGIETIMGNIDAASIDDLTSHIAVLCITIAVIFLSYRELICTSFDPSFASSIGFSNHWIEIQLMVLTSCVVVTSFKAIGYILALAFIVGIPLCCKLFLQHQAKISTMLAFSLALSWTVSICAVWIAHLLFLYADLPVSTGGVCAAIILALTLLPKRRRVEEMQPL